MWRVEKCVHERENITEGERTREGEKTERKRQRVNEREWKSKKGVEEITRNKEKEEGMKERK